MGIPFRAVAALIFAVPGLAAADMIVLPDGAEATVRAAFAAAPATGTRAIVLPPGAWVWPGAIGSSRAHTVVLGSGPAKTRIYRTSEEERPFIRFLRTSDVRVAELAVDGNAASTSASRGQGVTFSDVTDFRVDHARFSEHGGSGVRSDGESRGVVDHCAFSEMYKAPIGTVGYGVVVMGTKAIVNEPFGSPRATFVEDSAFKTCRHAIASNDGARYVFRHNEVTRNIVSHAIDAHGQEFGSTVGTEWVEAYQNTVSNPVEHTNAVRIRGGKGLVWNNALLGYDDGVSLLEDTPQQTGPVNVWGNRVTNGQINAGRGATYATTALAGYVPYTHPHPLVTALRANAGLDRVIDADASGTAEVWLDTAGSMSGSGAIVAQRWYGAQGLLASCGHAIVRLAPGTHAIGLEVQRTDGRVAHDSAVVQVVASSPLASAPALAARSFRPVARAASVAFDLVVTKAGASAIVGLAGASNVASVGATPIQVRASGGGSFELIDGASFRSLARVPCDVGRKHHIVINTDLALGLYDASVDGTVMARGFALHASTTRLSQVVAWSSATGDAKVSGVSVLAGATLPDVACARTKDSGSDRLSPDDDLVSAALDPDAIGPTDSFAAELVDAPTEEKAPVSDTAEGCATGGFIAGAWLGLLGLARRRR